MSTTNPIGNFVIRPARPDELPLLPAIEDAAGELFAGIGMAEISEDGTTISLEELQQGRVWVAEADGKAVGFACAMDIELFSYLREISVLPDYGKRGIGRALIDAVIDDARTRKKLGVTLSTFRTVPWNGPWYASLGFDVLSAVALGKPFSDIRAAEAAQGLNIHDRDLMMLALY